MLFDFLAKRQLAANPVGNGSGIMRYGKPVAGVRVNDETAFTYSAFWACMRLISETIAYLPWHVHAIGKNAPESGHYLDSILYRKPNDEMSAFTYRELKLQHVLGWGNAVSEKEFNRLGEVAALWPIDPSRIEIDRTRNGALVYLVNNGSEKATELSPKEVYHVRGPSRDGVKGYSVIELARETISLGLATEAFGASFFGNGAFPATVIMNNGTAKMSDEGTKNLLDTFNAKNQGPRNARRTQYLSPGLDLKVIGIPPADSQFIETRNFNALEICRWFRVQPHKIAQLERSTNNNIEAQNIEHVTDTLMPWISRMESQANFSLFKPSEAANFYTKINVKGLLRGDSKARAEWYKTLQGMGVYSIDDILEKEDEERIGGEVGDLRLVPVNMVTAERMAKGETQTQSQSQQKNQNESDSTNDANIIKLFEREASRITKIECKRVVKVSDETAIANLYAEIAKNSIDAFLIPAAMFAHKNANDSLLESRLSESLISFYTESANTYRAALENDGTDPLLQSWEASKSRKLTQHVIEALRGLKNV